MLVNLTVPFSVHLRPPAGSSRLRCRSLLRICSTRVAHAWPSLGTVFVIGVGLNFVWEMAQGALYEPVGTLGCNLALLRREPWRWSVSCCSRSGWESRVPIADMVRRDVHNAHRVRGRRRTRSRGRRGTLGPSARRLSRGNLWSSAPQIFRADQKTAQSRRPYPSAAAGNRASSRSPASMMPGFERRSNEPSR